MNSRERFLKTINRKVPDRPPIFATFTPQVAEKMSKHLGIPYEEPVDSMLSTRASHMDLLVKLGNDAVGIAACAPSNFSTQTHKNGLIENEWGMVFKPMGLYNEFFKYPLAHAETIEDIEKYKFPDPLAKGRWEVAKMNIRKYGNTHGIIADLETTIFETAWYLVGLEKFLMDLMMEAEYVNPLLDKIQEIHTHYGKTMIELGADVLWCGDDFGTQQSQIMSIETFRKYFKPRYKVMFDEFKKVNPDIKLAWHSCGAFRTFIPEFVDIGLDIVNPLQPMAADMEPQSLKDEFGDELVFFGGVCVQDLLPNKSPNEIKNEIKRRKEIFGKGGGYIAAPAHNIQDDTSIENILAFFKAAT
ncbi:MAG: uroporphyrinogen decarboxylase family protein [Draconibacterium sp.]|nr:uroporphyrinogen decarboxylase family protein [Draconibacterium sp.]